MGQKQIRNMSGLPFQTLSTMHEYLRVGLKIVPADRRGAQNLNQVNQANPRYTELRARANEEGDVMAKASQESHEAYQGGDGALAKELSNKGKRHQAEMERAEAPARC